MKLFIGFLIFTLFIVSLSWAMFNLFFENYYLTRQKNSLLEYGSQFDTLYTGDVESVYEYIEKIAHSTGRYNCTLFKWGNKIYNFCSAICSTRKPCF